MVGYEPEQPVAFSHAVHVQQLGMDCRFCHTAVEVSAGAGIPSTQTCVACHGEGRILSESARLAPVRESWKTGLPIPWVRVHRLPDYVYFHHAVHVQRGVSCTSCHGNVAGMEAVRAVKPLTMGWCLQCHRQPEKFLSFSNEIFRVSPQPQGSGGGEGVILKSLPGCQPSVSCGACHR